MQTNTIDLQVKIGDHTVTTYQHEGKTFVEGREGTEYALRVTNPHQHRVKVVLSVDGVNIVSIQRKNCFPAHLIGGMRNQHRPRSFQTKVSHHGEATVLIKAPDLFIGDIKVRGQEGDSLGFVDVQGRLGREGAT